MEKLKNQYYGTFLGYSDIFILFWLSTGSVHSCWPGEPQQWYYTDPAWLSLTNERKFIDYQQQIDER